MNADRWAAPPPPEVDESIITTIEAGVRRANQRAIAAAFDVPGDVIGMTETQNSAGEWVPAIPLPLFTFPHRHRCECRRAFWTLDGYRGHYALAHVLKLTP